MGDTFNKVGRSTASRPGKPVYAVTEQIDESSLREPPEFHGHWDPHVWMDVSLWSECVGFVAEALGEFDPPHADYYSTNADAYRAKLEKRLPEYVRSMRLDYVADLKGALRPIRCGEQHDQPCETVAVVGERLRSFGGGRARAVHVRRGHRSGRGHAGRAVGRRRGRRPVTGVLHLRRRPARPDRQPVRGAVRVQDADVHP